ncbi:RNA-directed DNA polymerase [Tanacetum coccineum]
MSPCAVPALLVPKHGGTFWMCIDSRAMKKITIKYRFPISRLDDLLDQLHGSTIFSQIDLRSGYHQIWMRPGDEWKTVFKTRDGLYEWMVMPFGLSNAPSTFMCLMNQAPKLYANGKKCHFLVTEVTFLGYIVTGSGIKMDPPKVEAIISWPTPSTIHDIRSFHREASKAFDILKAKETKAPVLALPNFEEVFQVECDASRVGIGGVLNQNQRPIAFFNEKLNDPRRKYSTYDKEFYAIVRSLAFSFVVRHKTGSNNQVAGELSHRHSEIWSKCDNGPFQWFTKMDGYMFKGARLCIPLCSLHEAIVLKGYAGGLAGHCVRGKTLALFCEQFYWPKMVRDVNRLLERCRTCHVAKNHSSNAGLYTPLYVPVAPWEDVSLDFVLGRNPITSSDLVPDPKVDLVAIQREIVIKSRLGRVFQEGEDDADAVNERVNDINGNSSIDAPNPNSFNDPPNIFTHPPQPQYESYSCELCGNDAHYGYDCPPRYSIDHHPQIIQEDQQGKICDFSQNPLYDSNDDFNLYDDESHPMRRTRNNVKIYSNPLFEFDDEYISSDVNPLFDEVLEDIKSKDSYVSNFDEPTLLVTPLSDANEDECFDPGAILMRSMLF